MTKIALCADSTCDIGDELQQRYNITFVPYTIISRGKAYHDNIDIHPNDLFEAFWEDGSLPQTGAVNEEEYRVMWDQLLQEYDELIHITLGGAITSSAEHAANAAKDDPRVHVLDSQTLSTGTSLLLIRAGELIEAGMEADEIMQELAELRSHTHASFILDTLEFMHAGGRCSAFEAIFASMLKIKPSIIVDNQSGAMTVDKKYRGKLKSVVRRYVTDQMDKYPDVINDHVFITHTDIPQECVDEARKVLEERIHPKHIHDTIASCTISCHCGPGTLGVLFLTESACK